jgi:recombination DNA repair RAD52 pathway protein
MSYLSQTQIDWLLRGIDKGRVKRSQGHDHIEQWDVRRWLTRIFGFGRWSMEVIDVTLVHERPRLDEQMRDTGSVDVLYRATVRVSVMSPEGKFLARYEDVATGDAQNQPPISAHDLALKSAVSTALKRACTCLGDQFGLSLYNGGIEPVVKRSLVAGSHYNETDPVLPDTSQETVEGGDIEADEPAKPTQQEPIEQTSANAAQDLVESYAATLAKLAEHTNKQARTKEVTRLSLAISKDGLVQSMTSQGVTLQVLIDQAFVGGGK